MRAKKKESTNFDALCISDGDCVSVENHGKHWMHLGYIISIDKSTKTAVVKWEETWKKDTVHLGDVLGLLANLKETRKVRACQVEAKYYEFYLRSNGCDTRNGN